MKKNDNIENNEIGINDNNIIVDNKKEIIENSEIEYINNILPLRERLKLRNKNLSNLLGDKNNNIEKKINYPKPRKRKKSYSSSEEKPRG